MKIISASMNLKTKLGFFLDYQKIFGISVCKPRLNYVSFQKHFCNPLLVEFPEYVTGRNY